MFKPLPGYLVPAFVAQCDKLAEAYLASPTETNLYLILALVKVGVVPALRAPRSKAVLHAYPAVPFPERDNSVGLSSKVKKVTRLVETGRLGSAARVLASDSKVVEVTDELAETLQALHPVGEPDPFGISVGPSQGRAPNEDDVKAGIGSLKWDTAAGLSGWSVAFLRLASRSPRFLAFLTSLIAGISAGTAPGASMLCAARLTPIGKANGGIRPITVGDLLYRLATKVIQSHAFKPDFLEKYQLGVGSKGGVEPIVQAVERAREGTLDQRYTHVASLDFANAFNTLARRDIAEGLRKHAKSLYRTGRWAYGAESDLVVGDRRLKSSRGARQGDPLGPLFFSLGIRDTLVALAESLGPTRRIMSYLDDIFIFSTDSSALDDAFAFFDARTSTLQLNKSKCECVSLEQVGRDGWKLLGTCVGPASARRSFLSCKIAKQVAKLDSLIELPHQHALLILRQCLQQDLRHLQRTLKTDDLDGVWDELDNRLIGETRRMRARVGDDGESLAELDRIMAQLPARHGGLGLLSHSACAPHAYAAAAEASDIVVHSIFELTAPDEQVRKSQSERCKEMFETVRERVMATLDDSRRKVMVESSSVIGRKWLSVIPYYQPLRLSNFEIASELHRRSLAEPSRPTCRLCGDTADFGHDEVCNWRREKHTIARHDQVVLAIGHALHTLDDRVVIEPHTYEGRRRNDIRLAGSNARGRTAIDYDVKIYSLMAGHAHSTTTRKPVDSTNVDHAVAQCIKYLASVAKVAEVRRPWAIGDFKPLVVSLGGLMEKQTAAEVAKWKREMTETVFEAMVRRVSLVLLRARAKVYEG